jgi:DNA-binding MarR family transcriptional regulator
MTIKRSVWWSTKGNTMTNSRESSPQSLLDHIGDARRQVQKMSAEFLTLTGYTASQAAILVSLLRKEGVSQTHLSAVSGIDRSTMADVVRRLQKKGLVARKRTKEDARAYSVRLTVEGRSAALWLNNIT